MGRFDRWTAVAVFGCLVWVLVYSFARKPIQAPPANVQVLRETVHHRPMGSRSPKPLNLCGDEVFLPLHVITLQLTDTGLASPSPFFVK